MGEHAIARVRTLPAGHAQKKGHHFGKMLPSAPGEQVASGAPVIHDIGLVCQENPILSIVPTTYFCRFFRFWGGRAASGVLRLPMWRA